MDILSLVSFPLPLALYYIIIVEWLRVVSVVAYSFVHTQTNSQHTTQIAISFDSFGF